MTSIAGAIARLAVFAAPSLIAAGVAHAQYRGGPGAGVESGGARSPIAFWLAHAESTNILRTGEATHGDYDSLGALFNLTRTRERLEAGLTGNLEYRSYGEAIAPDERVGAATAFLNAELVPRRLSWDVQDRYMQGRTNPLGPETPGNRENINVFSTGPKFDVPLGDRSTLGAESTFTSRKYSESTQLDGKTLTHQVGLYRRVHSTTSLGLTARSSEIEYDIAAAFDYEIEAVQLTYQRTLSKGRASAAIGQNTMIVGDSESDKPAYSMSWGRILTGRSSFILTANRQLSEAGQLAYSSLGEAGMTPTDVTLSDDATDRRNIAGRYILTLPRTDITLQAMYLDDDFQRDDALDSDGRRLGVDVLYRLTGRSMLAGSLHRESRRFADRDDANEDTVLRLRYSRELGRAFNLEVDAEGTKRDGFDSFNERIYRITVVYIPGGRR